MSSWRDACKASKPGRGQRRWPVGLAGRRDAVFAVPDPMLRHIDIETAPAVFTYLPEGYDKSLRGRYLIMAICAGLPELLAWFYALDRDPEMTAEIEAGVLSVTDEQIAEMMATSEHWQLRDR